MYDSTCCQVLVVAADMLAVAADRQQTVQLFHVRECGLELGDALIELVLQRDHAHADVDARAQLVDVERLGHVVVRARIEADTTSPPPPSEVSSTRYMFAFGMSRRTRRQTSAPSTPGIMRSSTASADADARWRHASAPSPTTGDVEFPARQRLREHRGRDPIVVRDEHFHANPPGATPL